MRPTWPVLSRRYSAARLALWTAAFVGAGYVGRVTIIDGTALSLVWPAAGVAVLWFATSTRRTVTVDVLTLSAATFVVNASTGARPALAAVFVAANLLQAGLVLVLARWWIPGVWGFGGRRPLGRLEELGRLVVAALLGCLAAALLGSAGLRLTTGGGGTLLTFLAWWGRNTVGLVAVGLLGLLAGPALVAAARSAGALGVVGAVRRAVCPRSPVRAVEAVLLAGTTLGVYLAVFTAPAGSALAFLVLVPTFWAGIRFSPLAATVHSLGCATAAVGLTLLGEGPFLTFDEVTARALVAQLCVLMTMVAGLSLAFSHAQERTVAAELTSLMDASRLVALVSTDLGGRVRTFGVGAERLLGYDAGDVVHRPLSRFVDAAELHAAAHELGVPTAEVLAELARREGEPRTWTLVRKDGSRLFARLALSQLRDAEGTVTGYLGVAIDVTEAVQDQRAREHLQQQLAHLAHHDPLTGLPNRRWFEGVLREHLAATGRNAPCGVLLMLDLDRFKDVNDTLGHAAGDALLVTTADVLRRHLRHTDAVARLGGDEFAVLLTDTDLAGAERAAQGLVDAVRAHTAMLAPVCRRVTLSVGGVAMVPGGEAVALLQAADAALYEAKRCGRDRQVVRTATSPRNLGRTG